MNARARLSSVIPCVFTGIAVIVALTSVWAGWQSGTLIILTLTLIAVIWYTYYTYQLAVKKEGAIVIGTIQYVPEARDVRVIISNPTIRYAAANVCVSVKVYGRPTDLGATYSGKTVWHLTPQFAVNGHFLLENLLNQVGKTFEQMTKEANDNNITRQL
jgi:hypothetical protein